MRGCPALLGKVLGLNALRGVTDELAMPTNGGMNRLYAVVIELYTMNHRLLLLTVLSGTSPPISFISTCPLVISPHIPKNWPYLIDTVQIVVTPHVATLNRMCSE